MMLGQSSTEMNQPTANGFLLKDAVASVDSLVVMLRKERTAYVSANYLRIGNRQLPEAVTEVDRTKIVNWCYDVVNNLVIDSEIVAIAMEMFDRFHSTPSIISGNSLRDPRLFQLLAIASLYLAIKTNAHVTVEISLFAEISDGLYTSDEIEAMEMNILKGLSWQILAPTSIQTAHHILSLVRPQVDLKDLTWRLILDEVRHLTEHAVREYYFSTQRPSTIAMAAISNSTHLITDKTDRQGFFRAVCSVYGSVTDWDFATTRDLLAARVRLHNHRRM